VSWCCLVSLLLYGNQFGFLYKHNNLEMKTNFTKTLFTTIAIASVVIFSGCKKDDTEEPKNKEKMSLISLKNASSFAILGGSTVTSTGNTEVTGDIGLNPGTSIIGFPPGIFYGTMHIVDSLSILAKSDLTAAYNDAAGRVSTDVVLVSGNIGGRTLLPGLYKSSSALEVSSGDLTLDAKGDANAVWVFQVGSTLELTSGRKIILSGGALASNIYWQVSSSAIFRTTSVMKGTIMALESISFETGATLDGKALAISGAVSLDANMIVIK